MMGQRPWFSNKETCKHKKIKGDLLCYVCKNNAYEQGRASMREDAMKVCEEQLSLCRGDDDCSCDSITDCIKAIKELP